MEDGVESDAGEHEEVVSEDAGAKVVAEVAEDENEDLPAAERGHTDAEAAAVETVGANEHVAAGNATVENEEAENGHAVVVQNAHYDDDPEGAESVLDVGEAEIVGVGEGVVCAAIVCQCATFEEGVNSSGNKVPLDRVEGAVAERHSADA